MSDTEVLEIRDVEQVSFLPGGSTSDRQALYEPSTGRKASQVICGKTKAIFIVIIVCALILGIALIAAFARSACPPVAETPPTIPTKTSSLSQTAAIATNLTDFPWKDIRLPKAVAPDSYRIQMNTDLKTFVFKGSVSITLKETNDEPDFIVLHSAGLSITGSKLTSNVPKDTVSVSQILEYKDHQQLYVKLSEKLAKDRVYILNLDFESALDQKLTGFYRSSYKDENDNIRWLAVTQFESVYARTAFPCFDEPSFKANFSLSMTHQKDYISLFNMPQIGESQPHGDDLVISHFESSVKMSSYLVAFVVCDYDKKTDSSHKYTVNIYAPKHLIGLTDWALEVATKVLPSYEEFYGQPYPLPKQDLIAIPDFESGAMENWGLITYRMVELLYNPKVATAVTKERVAIVVAHELAHQWFGNLVTMDWWNDLWLNEGFASYVEVKGVGDVMPQWGMDYRYVLKFQRSLALDSLVHSHPISVSVEDPKMIDSIFDTISYDKGSSLIRMMGSFIGEDVLKAGLKSYLDKFKYGNARTVDLWDALSEANTKMGGKTLDVTDIMDTWTTQMGYPLITVSRTGDTVSATQTRFYSNGKNPSTAKLKKLKAQSPYPEGYSWEVPLTYRTQANSSRQLLWMKRADTAPTPFPVSGNWFKVNVNETMFYRVNYDDASWRALTEQLDSDHTVLSASDRSNLIDDAFTLSKASILSSDTALNMTRYLSKEEDFLPWTSAAHWIFDATTLVPDDEHFTDLYEKYAVEKLTPVLKKLGLHDVGSHLTRFLRTSLFEYGINFNVTETVTQAKDLFDKWMKQNKSIPLHLKSAVLNAGIKYGGETEWNFCLNYLQATHDPSEASLMHHVLAQSTDVDTLKRYLGYALQHDKIKSQDGVSVIVGVSRNPIGRELTWDFVKKNWNTLFKIYADGPFILDNLISGVTSSLSTDALYTEVEGFFKDKLPNNRAVKQSLEKMKININWRKTQQNVIQTWLENEASS